MYKYIAILAFLLIPKIGNAQGLAYVQEVAFSSGTVYTVAITSQTSVNVTTSTANGRLNGAYAVEVYNLAANANTVNCGYDSNVSTTSTSNFYGREIAAGTGMVWHVLQGQIGIFCLTQSVTGSTRVTVTQIR